MKKGYAVQQVSCPIYWISTVTLHSVTGWMIFVSSLSMKNFFLGEFIHLILHRKGGGAGRRTIYKSVFNC